MAILNEYTPLQVKTVQNGIYQGFNPVVAFSAKVAIMLLVAVLAILAKGLLAFLFLILIVVSSSAAIIAIKAIGAAGGDDSESTLHSMIWAVFIAAVSGSVMAVGGVDSIGDVMIVGALPFSGIMGLMTVSVMLAALDELKRVRKATIAVSR